MQKRNGRVYYSASDLVNYLECEHLTALDQINLETPLPRTEDDEQARLIQDKGYAHEDAFLKRLQARHAHVVDLSANSTLSLDAQVAATQHAMQAGAEIIFQATLADGELVGHADFLRKVPRPSALGDWGYEVLDTKLARSPKAKFVVQLGFYSALLTKAQGAAPRQMHVVLGSGEELPYRCADYAHYLERITAQFLARVQGEITGTYPAPCDKCSQCRWRGLCDERRLKDDHLSQVAGISKLQIRKLETANVTTLAALATLAPDTPIPRLNPDTLARLANQARLQHQARETGQRHVERLPAVAGELRGFGRLPRPDAGDLFFDMEGDPLEDGGLEYLFGLYYFDNGEPSFKPFWAHSRAEEKRAFEAFMDFVTDWLQTHPHAHIYHYAHYEQTALKRLMSLHGTREAEVDNLLRTHKLVDLYKVVREGIRVSEPGYSIKNIEHFYLDQRSGEVTNAGASIVFYERWKETGDPQLLEDIARYNFDDVRSTYLLQQWLLTLRPDDMPWADIHWHGDDAAKATPGQLNDAEKRLIPYRNALVAPLPEDRTTWTTRDHLAELTYQLLDFHRRAAKPAWWELFARTEKTEEELLEDGECLAGLIPDPAFPPEQVKRSMRYTYRYPEQDFKLRTGASATIAQTGVGVNELTIDEDARRVSFKLGPKKEAPMLPLALGPGQPVSSKELINAVFRFADSLIAGDDHYPAIESILSISLMHDFDDQATALLQDFEDIERDDSPSEREDSRKSRLGQGTFRRRTIEVWGGIERCVVTGIALPALLTASHIIPWSEDKAQRKLGCNGIMLAAHLDRLFDRFLIGFGIRKRVRRQPGGASTGTGTGPRKGSRTQSHQALCGPAEPTQGRPCHRSPRRRGGPRPDRPGPDRGQCTGPGRICPGAGPPDRDPGREGHAAEQLPPAGTGSAPAEAAVGATAGRS